MNSQDFRTLGKTGIKVSPIGVGAWQLGGPLMLDGKVDGHPDLGEKTVVDLIHACGDMGINFIDTAEQYAAGDSERRVGKALRGQRDRWIIGSKFGWQVGPKGERVTDVSAKRVPISLEGSLERLGVDCIDLYVYHPAPDPAEVEGVAAYLAEAKEAGKIRAVGFSGNRLEDAKLLAEAGCLDVVQYASNLLQPADELRKYLVANKIGGVVRGAFAGGRLCGKYFDKAPEFSPDDIRKNWFSGEEEKQAAFTNMAAFRVLLGEDRDMVQLALRYLLDLPGSDTIILGAKSVAEYQHALTAVTQPPLSSSDISTIQDLRKTLL